MRRVLALSYVPWRYVRGPQIEELRSELRTKFRCDASLFASGREGLLALLRAMNIRPGEEVVVQGYTCVVVPNAIHAAGATPVYADIDPTTLNLTAASVEACLSPRTRAVICQHTFGIPAETQALRALCDRHKLLLIEDCAHVLPDASGPEEIGKLGDALLLSFGRDKAISGISGGAMLVRDPVLAAAVQRQEETAIRLPWHHVMTLLEYAPRMRLIRHLLWCRLDRPVVKLLGILGMIPRVVTEEEKEGAMSPILRKIPNICAALALFSLRKLPELNRRRSEVTALFLDFAHAHAWPVLKGIRADLPLQKFPLFLPGAEQIRHQIRRHNIHLYDGWTRCVVCPEGTDLDHAGYELGSDPEAERACLQILSLPTHPTMTLRQAKRLAEILDPLLGKVR